MHTFLAVCLLFVLPPEILSQCNSTDDLWSIHCVRLSPYYSDYQWATCVSSEYLSASSGLQHKCRGDNAPLCYNQCMLESFDASQGGVCGECACNPNGTLPLEPLPPRCYVPDGGYCGWYGDCLKVLYPCLAARDTDAVAFSEKLCNTYVSHYNDFGVNGRTWMDAARSCSLFALVPLVRPWAKSTCSNVSVASKTGCYLLPEFTRSVKGGVPFLCDLSYVERVKLFWILFGSVSSDGVFQEPADQMLHALNLCSSDDLVSAPKFRTLVTAVLVQCAFFDPAAVVQPAQWEGVARETVNSIASTLKWGELGIGWFSTLGDDGQNITVWLVDVKALGVSNLSASTAETRQVGSRVAELGSAYRRGMLSALSVPLYGNKVTAEVLFVGECGDLTCTNVTQIPAANGGVGGRGCVYALSAVLSLTIWSL